MSQLITDHLATWTTAPNGIKKMRELILELAVRGLLVPQDANDEPASELLKKIAVEKAQLVGEGKIKPSKPLAKISEGEKPFDLPLGWEWERLGRLTYIEMGQSPSSSSYNQAEDGMPFFQGKADFGKISPTPRYWCTEPQKIAYPDDVLLSVRAPVGSTNLNNIECCIGRGLAALRPLAETNCYFLLYLMRSFQTKLESFSTGTTFAAVSKSDVESFPVPLPPLAEQQRIVAKVDELMQLCDRLEEKQNGSQAMHRQLVSCLLTTLTEATDSQAFQAAWSRIAANFNCLFTTENSIEQLKQTILQLAVMGKLVPQNPNDEPASELLKKIATEKAQQIKAKKFQKTAKLKPKVSNFEFPQSWERVQVGELCPSIVPNRDKPKTFSGQIPWVTLASFPKNGFYLDHDAIEQGLTNDEVDMYSARLIPENTVLMSCIGRFGLTAINKVPVVPNQQIHGYVILNGLVSEFLSIVIKVAAKELENIATSTTIAYLNKTNCESIEFGLPPTDEQHRIVAKVDELMTLCEQLKTRLATAQTLQQQLAETLVQQAVA